MDDLALPQRPQSGDRADVELIVFAPKMICHGAKAGAIVGPALHAEGIVDDAIDPRPLVPCKAASETDRGRSAREAICSADELVPGAAELDFIETAVTSGYRITFKNQGALEEIGMMCGQPVQFPDL